MLLSLLAATVPLVSLGAAFTPASTSGTDRLAAKGLDNLARYEAQNNPPAQCNYKTGYVRQEWSALSTSQKKSYISAVLCLQALPAESGNLAPGAMSRYDDFVATHINQTLTVHGTGNFLSWHRYLLHTFETALREECNYNGYLPYYNWGRYAFDIHNAPIWDGSDTSISGNGVYQPHNDVSIPSAQYPFIVLPASNGGGCVYSGPFKNYTVNLGPVAPALDDVAKNPQANGLGYNPRCMRRDISSYASISTTDQNSTDLINNSPDILTFQNTLQGNFAAGLIGIHTAGHFSGGGDPGGDIFASPGDPFFWLHHAQIDRTWWIWQNQDLANRQNAIAGTLTLLNNPPSRNATLNDTINLGVNAGDITIASAMSTLGGDFCYIYA